MPAGELCERKDRVGGWICDTCKPLFWNLQASNPDACENCNCFPPGVMGNLQACDVHSGQCVCKPFVSGRRCQYCADGFFNMTDENAFGCQDCECNVGRSTNRFGCDKVSAPTEVKSTDNTAIPTLIHTTSPPHTSITITRWIHPEWKSGSVWLQLIKLPRLLLLWIQCFQSTSGRDPPRHHHR